MSEDRIRFGKVKGIVQYDNGHRTITTAFDGHIAITPARITIQGGDFLISIDRDDLRKALGSVDL